MTLQIKEQISTVNDYIETSLIPELENIQQVHKFKKAGNLFFFLVSNSSELSLPTRFILTYEVQMAEHDNSLIECRYMDSSLAWTEYSIKCPNTLLSQIDRTHSSHKQFIDACLEYQGQIKNTRLERPLKVELLRELKETNVINSNAYGKIAFKQITHARKGEFKARNIALGILNTYNIDDLTVNEIKKALERTK